MRKKEDTIIYSLLALVYQLLTNEIFEAIITIIFPILIGLIDFQKKMSVFWAVIIAYGILIILMTIAQKHQKRRIKEYKMLNQASFGINITLRGWAIKLQNCAKGIFNLNKKSKEYIQNTTASISFQNAAFLACEKIRTTLTKYCDNDNVYVTIFQKEKNPMYNTCRMIAYSGEYEPSTYRDSYIIPNSGDNLYGKIEYHSYLFASNKTDISVLPDRNSVKKAFVYHDKAKERENGIQQYIAIPIAPEKLGVTFILQIDTTVEQLFGKSEKDVLLFAKTAIYPFAQFLHMSYEQSRAIQQIMEGIT